MYTGEGCCIMYDWNLIRNSFVTVLSHVDLTKEFIYQRKDSGKTIGHRQRSIRPYEVFQLHIKCLYSDKDTVQQ